MTRSRLFGLSSLFLLATMAGWNYANAAEPTFRSSGSSKTTNLDCAQRASKFPPINLGFFTEGFSTQDGSENSIRCTARVRDGGKGRKGVKIAFGGEIVLLDNPNNSVVSLPTKRGKTDRDGNLEIDFPIDDLPNDDLAVIIDGTFKTRKKIDSAKVECNLRNRMPCQPDNETLCLLDDGRFKVDVDWTSSNSSGTGMVIKSGFDSGSFYFFNPNNTNLLVQLLDACSNNDHFWVFANANTNVEYDLTVTDTATGFSRVYENELGQAAQAITDTSAFATCP